MYGAVLFPSQASLGAVKDATLTQMGVDSTIDGLSTLKSYNV